MLTNVARPRAGFQLILAYNTPEPMAIEAELRELARRHPEFTALRVHGSKSKAENVNFALKFATGSMIAVFDADHQPAPDCLARASRWIAAGYDMVQGRSVVRNPGNWHARLVAAEFETIYGIGHSAASLMAGGGMFCGSNGYWRAEALCSHELDASMLTEDIDLSIRAALAGRRMVHDRSIVSTELATTNMRALWAQRSRWARGWLEVTLRHQVAIWRSPRISWAQKAYFTLLLGMREVYNHASFLIFPLLLAYAATGSAPEHSQNAFMWASAIVTFATGPLIALAAARHSKFTYGWRTWAGYMSVVWLYAALKSLISLVAALDCAMARQAEWIVTPRNVAAPLAAPASATIAAAPAHGIHGGHGRRKMRGRARPQRAHRASASPV
jgi:cellulose synthase/poly-beta-1,6-N-acetylglucosamine synthase-like glycosyltransferase